MDEMRMNELCGGQWFSKVGEVLFQVLGHSKCSDFLFPEYWLHLLIRSEILLVVSNLEKQKTIILCSNHQISLEESSSSFSDPNFKNKM